MLNTIDQKINGFAMRGMRFEKKPLMSQSRPRSNAPEIIKNNAMPILKKLFANVSKAPLKEYIDEML
jgi:hypothetical protein